MVTLYHFTCDHGRTGIGDAGDAVPGPDGFVWLTDLEVPFREVLGLTRHLITCDRGRYRYRATDSSDVTWWPTVRRDLPREWVRSLESAPGVLPRHWFLSDVPVPVVFDPVGS